MIMETRIWINITFNAYDQLKGKEEFLAALKQDGVVVQERKIHYPSCCTGQEVEVIQVLINNPIIQYLAYKAMDKMVDSLLEYYVPRLFEALRKLKKQNQDFSIGCLQFEFDDITIKIKDLYDVDYAYLQNTFYNMGEHIEYLKNNTITDIREISLPYVKNDENFEENRDKYTTPLVFTKEIDYYWKIEYGNGCMICYYNPKDRAIIEV